VDRRRTTLALVLLLALGMLAGWLARGPILGAFRSTRAVDDEQVRSDAIDLLQVVRPDENLPAELPAEFWAVWDAQRRRYPPERLADLRQRLDAYLDFLQAEHADAREIYRNGLRPEGRSDAAEEARRRVRAAFGDFARTLEEQVDGPKGLREDAYKASPKVAGFDPELPDYEEVYLDLVQNWFPRARARVDELTAPPR
jgi:hypothetical protein